MNATKSIFAITSLYLTISAFTLSTLYQDEMPQSGPEAVVEKEPEADSISTSSGEGHAGPNVTVLIKTQPPITPARQRSSDSNRTEPSDEKKGKI